MTLKLFISFVNELNSFVKKACIKPRYCYLEQNLCYFSYSFPSKISYEENFFILTNLEANKKIQLCLASTMVSVVGFSTGVHIQDCIVFYQIMVNCITEISLPLSEW